MRFRFILSSDLTALFILLLALIPTLKTLFTPGFFLTHDGDYHVVRLARFYETVTTAGFPVRMVPAVPHNYGYPAFTFFYVFPYMVSSIFHAIGFDLGESLKIFIALTSLFSVYAMYGWLRSHFKVYPALVGSLLYLFVPFRFVTLYVTGQLGGLTSFLWAPLLLLSLYRLIVKQELSMVGLIGLITGAFLLSHIISFVAFLPMIGMYVLYLLFLNKKVWKKRVALVVFSFVLGAGVASFYVIPATVEKPLIRMGVELLINYQDHWLTLKQLLYSRWGYGYSGPGDTDLVSFQIGIAQWGVLAMSIFSVIGLMIWKKKNLDQNTALTAVFLVVFGLIVFLMLPISTPIWESLSVLQNLQYPWRLLAVLMFLSAFFAAWLASLNTLFKWGMVGTVILAMIGTRNYLRNSEPNRYPDSHYLENSFLYSGTLDISGELMPAGRKNIPMYAEKSLINQPPIEVVNVAQMDQTFSLNLETDQPVVLNRFYYPNWQVLNNDQPLPTSPNENGLLSFPGKAGRQAYRLKIVETEVEKVSNWISLLSLTGALLIIYQTLDHPLPRIPLNLAKYSTHTRKNAKN